MTSHPPLPASSRLFQSSWKFARLLDLCVLFRGSLPLCSRRDQCFSWHVQRYPKAVKTSSSPDTFLTVGALPSVTVCFFYLTLLNKLGSKGCHNFTEISGALVDSQGIWQTWGDKVSFALNFLFLFWQFLFPIQPGSFKKDLRVESVLLPSQWQAFWFPWGF